MNQDQNQSDPQKPEKQEDQAVPSTEELTTNDTQEQVQAETEQTKPASANTNTEQKSKVIKLIRGLALIILFIVIAFGLWKAYQPKTVEIQGRVEAETIHVSTKVPSRIDEIYVHDGQKISKNQELVRLYSPEVDAKKQQALASLQAALALQSTADRGSQEENIASLYANWQALKAQQTLAQTTYQRGTNLYQQGVISRQRRDEMHAAAQSAAQMTEAAYQQYARAERGSTPQQKSSADAQVQIAKAAVAEVNALEAETKLLSPIDGTVSKTYGKPSELVAMGVPIVSIIQDHELWVSLNIREDQYANIYQAKQIEGFIPALNLHTHFNIKNIDAEGEFATIKTTRQTGGYDIRSFKVHLMPAQAIPDLKVGMSVLFKVKESK